jgi:hypothetical protein
MIITILLLPLGHISFRHITIETLSMNVTRDSKLSPRNYNTCILFIPRDVTVEEGKIP